LLVLVVLSSSCGKKEQEKKSRFPQEIVDSELLVKVNDHPITGRDLRVFSVFFSLPRSDTLSTAAANEILLDRLIDRTLIWQEAIANGNVVAEDEFRETIASFIRSVGGEQALENFLAKSGIKREEFIATVKKDLLIRDFIEQRFSPQVKVTEEEARSDFEAHRDQFFSPDSVRARHILVRVFPSDDDSVRAEKRKKIEAVLAELKAGGDFASLAERYSDDPSQERGGDLGYFPRRAMVAPFDSAAFALKVGELSGVVETPFGYHIIKVEDKKRGRQLTFEQVKDRLMASLKDFRLAGVIENHLQEVRRVAIIEKSY